MAENAPRDFQLTVLNPGGRDSEQHFTDGPGEPGVGHQPTNFHGYAACTRGFFDRDVKQAIARDTPVLLLLRSDFKESEAAFDALKRAGRFVAVSLKETGLHQIANQLRDANKLRRFLRIVAAADACVGATPEAADIYRHVCKDHARVEFIATPYPVEFPAWNFSRPIGERAGIFIGTREFDVPSRNHLAALLLARDVSAASGECVTVYNLDGRTGRRLLDEVGFAPDRLVVREKQLAYVDYVREIAQHKIVLQLDTSFVPGQVAGDAVLARLPCVGGNGAVDRLAFPQSSGWNRRIQELREIALQLLTNENVYEQHVCAIDTNGEVISFRKVAAALQAFIASK